MKWSNAQAADAMVRVQSSDARVRQCPRLRRCVCYNITHRWGAKHWPQGGSRSGGGGGHGRAWAWRSAAGCSPSPPADPCQAGREGEGAGQQPAVLTSGCGLDDLGAEAAPAAAATIYLIMHPRAGRSKREVETKPIGPINSRSESISPYQPN